FAAAALIGGAVDELSGYVLIAYLNFRYESRLWATLALLVAVLLVISLLRLGVTLLTTSGRVVNPWSRRFRRRRVHLAIEHGQMDLGEGRWAGAQRLLVRGAEADAHALVY
ncbi:heme biosynthesis HemY N-terminal domain-containing protein, partial [Pseudomonas syringae pv. tagetis]|uniref:heme biosynthesis HemY N-terminal domain-containing protein n=1 Tax=Pseudomonas syringae group genomosp. 7 TaxID=251699 RepID=UPI00376F9ACD